MQASLRTTAWDKDSQVKPLIQSGILPLKQKKIAGVIDHSGLTLNSSRKSFIQHLFYLELRYLHRFGSAYNYKREK